MEIKLTIPDDKKDELLDAVCNTYSYQEMVGENGDEKNSETKEQFVKRHLVEHLQEIYKAWKKDDLIKNIDENIESINIT